MKIILIGIQGAGKSTQGNLLSEKLNIPYLSTGHIFRDLAKEKTSEGRYIKETVNSGYLIPDDNVLKIVSDYLHRSAYENGYILDGFPRTITQAKAFENGIDKVIYLKVSDKEALWRLSGRTDDREDNTLAAIRMRINLFHEFSQPVLNYYKEKGILIEIDGEKSVEEINDGIISKIK
ncbi:MAG: adenylate kinase [Candidatus Levybacteria bacterium CG_4_9_14_3_um_filter_35_16]|nr:MAG: adenylate kinase [Candidatus Levybacteria bacterium CG22_combo_CG10-13_8_21_14_all_35_11]PIY93854.1 MAG: adenylate kinase [Candidatus Levybacteria bacterium CG_4_10_14_0_8_um_filter_35_23]PIZ98150.1 MAG: adenylate kinase [Candidatus Levybacteria bacterium CG_4_10_14_0_2_um_filter_35_8]PJA91351.1 MAG: adenylate kinase [Candidatus Levybacteria bacterium CG_4_9_14_3_um_filter_35_16]PJC54790.1 MAG: adenylate kinase [Candidatus Levybacteria bacterium CG_4_9_14_0_2_um_filter_35_21]